MLKKDVKEEKEHWRKHFAKGFDALFDELKDTVPADFKTHTKNSIKEVLLAMESLLDKGIERLEEKGGSKKSPKKVEVT